MSEKKCLGFWKEHAEINEIGDIRVQGTDTFPCVTVSEHEDYKKKVKKAIEKLMERLSPAVERIIIKRWAEEELGLSLSEPKGEVSRNKRSVGLNEIKTFKSDE